MRGIFLGIDYSTYEATLVALHPDRRMIVTEEIRYRERDKEKGDTFVYPALTRVGDLLARSELIQFDGIHAIALERATGQSRRADWVLGAFFGAIYSALTELRPDCTLAYLNAQEWKREVTAAAGWRNGKGNANANKALAHQALSQIAPLIHPQLTGEDVDNLTGDERDALAIAWAYRRMSEKLADAAA